MAVRKEAFTKHAPAGNIAAKGHYFQIPSERNACDHKSGNLDLDLRISNPMNPFSKRFGRSKSGLGFAERNAKPFVGLKIHFWIRRKEHTPDVLSDSRGPIPPPPKQTPGYLNFLKIPVKFPHSVASYHDQIHPREGPHKGCESKNEFLILKEISRSIH